MNNCFTKQCFSVLDPVSVVYARNPMFGRKAKSIIKLIVHFQKRSVS